MENFLKTLLKSRIYKDDVSLIKFINSNNLFHFIYYSFKEKQNLSYCDLYNRISSYYIKRKKENLLLLAEWWEIKKILDEYNIECNLFKGLSLSYQLFQNPLIRITNDLDIFIDYEDFNKVKKILNDLGYEIVSPRKNENINEKNKKIISQVRFINKTKKFCIELHFSFFETYVCFNHSLKNFITYKEKALNFYNPEFLLLYTINHAWINSFNKFVYLSDISIMLEKFFIDYNFLKRIIPFKKNFSLVKISFKLCKFYFGTKVPDEFLKLNFLERIFYLFLRKELKKRIKHGCSKSNRIKKLFLLIFFLRSIRDIIKFVKYKIEYKLNFK